jgi:hypothetical protein
MATAGEIQEEPMNSFRWMACLISLAALTGPAVCDPIVGPLSGPVVHDNLAVYFVRGNGGGAAPLTLDEAMRSGQAQVRWTRTDPITVENLSDRSIFVPFGALLAGGLQDQVVSTSFVLPPHSGPIPLATFCVDPFRSAARDGEAADRLASPGAMFPGRMAKLAMMVTAPKSRAVRRLRQTGVWWSIDSTRAQLAHNLGVPMEPPRETHWNLAASQDQVSGAVLAGRESSWLTGLPLALENRTLVDAQERYANDLEAAAAAGDIVGAVFAVNGSLDGAEIYQSHALFAAMWPQILRAHAVEAIAASDRPAGTPPALDSVEAFLAAAQAGTARKANPRVRDSDAAIYAETSERGGAWVNRSFVATAHPAEAAGTPEALLLAMLETGEINTGPADARPIADLGDRDIVVLRRDPSGEGWLTAIEREADRAYDAMLAGTEGLAAALVSFALFALLSLLVAPLSHMRRRRALRGRFARSVGTETLAAQYLARMIVRLAASAANARCIVAAELASAWFGAVWPAHLQPQQRTVAMHARR